MRSILLATVLIAALNSPALARCGVERWPVKTGTDLNAAQVSLAPQPMTVAALSQIVAPPDPDVLSNQRFAPTELLTFAVTGTLVVIKREADETTIW